MHSALCTPQIPLQILHIPLCSLFLLQQICKQGPDTIQQAELQCIHDLVVPIQTTTAWSMDLFPTSFASSPKVKRSHVMLAASGNTNGW